MRTRTPIAAPSILSLLCTASLVIAGCGESRSSGGTKIRPRDAGTAATDCSVNSCVANQLVGPAPTCECLPNCSGSYRWNDVTMACDFDPSRDGGVIAARDGGAGTTRDGGAGTPRDGGVGTPRDGGMQQGACTVDSDCQANDPAGVCLFDDGQNPLARCAGQATCECVLSCDPFSTTGNTCGAGNACAWLGAMGVVDGICVVDGAPGQGRHNATCMTQYDLGGNRTGDSCNPAANTYCWGTVAPSQNSSGILSGNCASFCDDTAPAGWCESLGAYNCDPVGAVDGIGLCLGNPPNYTDLGNACTAANQCQGNLCSQQFAGSCLSSCGGLASCPANSECLFLGAPADGGEGLACIPTCTFGNDATCSGRNPELVCETIGQAPNTIDVCIPRCTDDTQCPGTCNTATGHCQ